MDLITLCLLTSTVMLLITFAFILYKGLIRNINYWKQKGVPHLKPVLFFGNFLDVIMLRATTGQYLKNLYEHFDEPYFGLYIFNKPHLVIKSPELIKSVFVRDFHYFHDHLVLSNEKCDFISSKMLFFLKNPEWKVMRNKLTAVFSSGKMKNMFLLMHDASDDLVHYLNQIAGDSKSLEIKEVCAKYSTDVIASCAFGINSYSFDKEDSEFRTIGRKMFDFRYSTALQQTAYLLGAETLIKLLKLHFFDKSSTQFLKQVFFQTIGEREKSDSKRGDLIDTIIYLKKQETLTDTTIRFEGDRVVAQATQFYTAGFETVSSTMAFSLYELCINPTIQDRLRTEIKNTIVQYGGFTYDAIQNMKYLHMVVCETLRKYPVFTFLERFCVQDYQIPNSNLIIEKDTAIFIPLLGLHYDPKYFPHPEKFNPERFSEENKDNLHAFTYLPFGKGPRNCIGERFALLSTKLGIARIIAEFEVERSEETPEPIQFETKGTIMASTVGFPMKLKKAYFSTAENLLYE